MATACVDCVQDSTHPCYGVLFYFTIPAGSSITESNSVKITIPSTAATTGEIEIAPTIAQASNGDYYYYFAITLNNTIYNFRVYKSPNSSTWILGQVLSSLLNVPWASVAANTGVDCIFQSVSSTTAWNISGGLPNFNIDRVARIAIPDFVDNSLPCSPPIDGDITNETVDNKIDTLYKCLDSKGTQYLNKLKGGIPCSNLELIKLSLILELMTKRNCTDVLPCIYTPTSETYLKTFVNYITKECTNCITTTLSNTYSNFDTVDKVPPPTQDNLTTPSGDTLTFENGITNIPL